MDAIEEFVDERQKAWCIHCGCHIADTDTNWDHVPTKSLLDRPLPAHTPQVEICKACNVSFSLDEEYLTVFLSCVLSGSTNPDDQLTDKIGRAMRRNPSIAARIDAGKRTLATEDGQQRTVWQPEIERINRIIIKNARGHAFYEFGEPMLEEPEHVWTMPLEMLTSSQRRTFEGSSGVAMTGWPEVGSRMLSRIVSGADLQNGWVVVQDGVYRYSVVQEGTLLVRSVIRNYLATEVFWA